MIDYHCIMCILREVFSDKFKLFSHALLVMILVLKSWFHIEDMISYKRKIWKVYVAKQKNIGVSTIFTVKTISCKT
jgi:hypothetical protein